MTIGTTDLLARFHLHVYLLVLLSLLGFTYAEGNLTFLLLGLLVLATSWWLVETPNAQPVPRWLINIGVLFSSLLLFWELAIKHENNLLRALAHFMLVLLFCKLFETKSRRDYAQILTLSLLLMVIGSIFIYTILFGTLLALYLALGLYTVVLFHLRSETAQALACGAVPSTLTTPPHRRLPGDLRRVTAYAGLILLTFATLVFLALPRGTGREMLGTWTLPRGATVTGLSDRIAFVDFIRLQRSPAVVMQVRLEQNGISIGSEYSQPYFRARTLDAYDPGRRQWLPHYSRDIRIPVADAGQITLVSPEHYSSTGMITQHYAIIAGTGGPLFSLGPAVKLHLMRPRSVTLTPDDLTLIYHGPQTDGFHYEVDTPLIYPPDIHTPPPPFPLKPGLLGQIGSSAQFPPTKVPQPIIDLARQVAGDLLPPPPAAITPEHAEQLANRFASYLRDHYVYSLEGRSVDPQLDPTADFLLHRQKIGGHCEYFASAMTMMCASVGIPARIVTGYHGGEYNALGEFYVVRQHHAHAWVEVFIPHRGWIASDPTPAASNPNETMFAASLRKVREAFQVLERSWRAGIVSFDNNTRRYLMDTYIIGFQSLLNNLKTWAVHLLRPCANMILSPSHGWLQRSAVLLAFLALAAGVTSLARYWHRRRTSVVRAMLRHLDRPQRRQLAQDLAFFDDFLRLLHRSGLRRHPSQTPREYVAAVTRAVHTIGPEASWLVSMFYDLRFGTLRMSPSLARRINASLAMLAHHLRQSTQTPHTPTG